MPDGRASDRATGPAHMAYIHIVYKINIAWTFESIFLKNKKKERRRKKKRKSNATDDAWASFWMFGYHGGNRMVASGVTNTCKSVKMLKQDTTHWPVKHVQSTHSKRIPFSEPIPEGVNQPQLFKLAPETNCFIRNFWFKRESTKSTKSSVRSDQSLRCPHDDTMGS